MSAARAAGAIDGARCPARALLQPHPIPWSVEVSSSQSAAAPILLPVAPETSPGAWPLLRERHPAPAQLPAPAYSSCLARRDLERLRQEWQDFCGSHSLGPGAAGTLRRQASEASLRLRPQTGPALLQDSMHQGEGAFTAAVPTCNVAATALSSGLACWQPLCLCNACTPHWRRGYSHTGQLADLFCFVLEVEFMRTLCPRARCCWLQCSAAAARPRGSRTLALNH